MLHNAGYKQGQNTSGGFIKSSSTPCPAYLCNPGAFQVRMQNPEKR